MIIDNNFNFNKNPFKNNNTNNQDGTNNMLIKGLNSFTHTNPKDTNEMDDKALAMLEDRRKHGTISKEDYLKGIKNIGKRRNK